MFVLSSSFLLNSFLLIMTSIRLKRFICSRNTTVPLFPRLGLHYTSAAAPQPDGDHFLLLNEVLSALPEIKMTVDHKTIHAM